MGFKTRITEMLGIEHPVVCGGMTGVGTVELTAAISNAGGLGMLTALTCGSPEQMKKDIERVRTLTDKPFAVNLTILPAMVPPDYEAYAKAIIESGVKVVETAGSNPRKWVTMFNNAGLITIHKCVTVRHAISAQNIGVKIVSVDGFECAGHPGEADIGNLVLLAKAAKKLTVPYLASGGIADGKQMAACLALGADGVNMGTRFCVTKEANWPQSFKQRVIDSDETQTALLFRSLHNTARVFKNKCASEVLKISQEKGKDLQFSDIGHLVAGTRGRQAEKDGDPDGGIFTAGQCIGLIDNSPSVKEVMDTFMAEAEDTITKRLNSLLTPTSRL